MRPNMKRLQSIFLALIVAVALLVRLGGVKFGLPELMHTDEARIILDSMSMGQRMSPLSEDVNYPLFTKYILTISYGVFFVVGSLIGLFRDRVDFAVQFLIDPSSIVLLSRIIMAILGTAGVIVAYYWGKLVDRSVKTGLVAALFISVEWQLVLESQYTLHQTLAALTSALAFLGMSLICSSGNKKAYVIGGATLGLAIASHQTTILLFPAILYLVICDFIKKKNSWSEIVKGWGLYSVLALSIGILGNLNYIFQFDKSLKFFLQGTGAAKVAFSSASYFSYDLPSIIIWYFAEFLRRNYFIGLLVFLGIATSLIRRKKLDIMYLIVSLTYFAFFYRWAFRWMHLFVGLIPISLFFAAKTFTNLTNKFRLPATAIFISFFLIVSPNMIDLVKMNLNKQNDETRQLARKWIEQYIPRGTKIAVDYPAHAVSLDTKYPTLLRNRVAMNYFDNSIPQSMKDMYFQLKDSGNTYEVVDMIDSRSEPVWPDFMPKEAVKRAASNPTMRDIYGYFNFKPINQISPERPKYIVITSYTYGMFLYSDDPRKVYLANTYIKDDILPFFNQGHEVEFGTQHELMYYVIKRGRDYFLQLLDNKVAGIKLIKEFYPNKNTSGPVVKIYSVD